MRAAVLGAVAVALLVPLLPLAVWSVSARWFFPSLMPTDLSLRAWRLVLAPTSDVASAFGTSLLVAVATTVLSVAFGVSAGRALGQTTFRGKRLVQGLFLLPLVVPPSPSPWASRPR